MIPPYTIIKQGAFRGRYRWQYYELDYTDPDTGVENVEHSASTTIQGFDTYEEAKASALRVLKNPGTIYQKYGDSYFYQDLSDRWYPAEG